MPERRDTRKNQARTSGLQSEATGIRHVKSFLIPRASDLQDLAGEATDRISSTAAKASDRLMADDEVSDFGRAILPPAMRAFYPA